MVLAVVRHAGAVLDGEADRYRAGQAQARATAVDVSPDVVWILAVGSDARPGEDMTRVRGDALQLIGMNTKTGAAAAIGVPRDSYVSIPGDGSDQINAALYYGGPRAARRDGRRPGRDPARLRVRDPVQNFANMVDDIGGIDVDNPTASATPTSSPRASRPASIHLNGYLRAGVLPDPQDPAGGDFDRSANQQRVLRGIQAKIRERAGEHGFIEKGVLSAHAEHGTTPRRPSSSGSPRPRPQVEPSQITTCVVQGGIGNIGGASVVLPYVDQARRLGDRGPRRRHPRVLRLTLTRQFWPFPATLRLCAQGQN